ncbi:family 43 glycosylhydrolase [Candidatus Woesearchaeota archaeon]|nr:family 43 glycosylhydrolase [Candidatus Woesearchaeota archaeon]
MKKRGISPLIATVLIIGFVIIASILVYNWGFDFLKGELDKESQKTKIANPVIGIDSYGYESQCGIENLCVFIVNDGNVIVEKLDILVEFTGGQQILSKDKTILPHQQGWVHLDGLDCSNGDVISVKVVPSILLDGEVTLVEYASVITSSIRTCGDEMEDPGEIHFVWETGRPSCDFNCEYFNSVLNSDDPSHHSVKDFTFFRDQNGKFHIISIKSIKCTAEPGCECSNYFCQAYDPLAENEFLHYTSDGLASWNRERDIIQVSENPDDFDSLSVWAPYILYEEGTYYMFYTGVKMEDCPGAGQCYAQRIMLATSIDAYNWEKQGFILDCDVEWNMWQNDESTSAGKRACRDSMVYKKPDGTWIMYLSTQVDDTVDKETIAYATSNDLTAGWSLQQPIEATRGYGSWGSESPFLFEYNDKYYLVFTGDTFSAAEIITETTSITSVNSLAGGSPTEYLEVVNNELLDGNYFLMSKLIYGDQIRTISFDTITVLYNDNLGWNDNEYCAVCTPQPNLFELLGICDYDQDCLVELGCADYSGFLDHEGLPLDSTPYKDNLCCDIGDPLVPEDACCETPYDESEEWTSIWRGAWNCWEICGGTTYWTSEGEDLIGAGYCDSTGHCDCSGWICAGGPPECVNFPSGAK